MLIVQLLARREEVEILQDESKIFSKGIEAKRVWIDTSCPVEDLERFKKQFPEETYRVVEVIE